MTTRTIRFVGGLILVAVLAVGPRADARGSAAASPSPCDGGDREIFITICP